MNTKSRRRLILTGRRLREAKYDCEGLQKKSELDEPKLKYIKSLKSEKKTDSKIYAKIQNLQRQTRGNAQNQQRR